MNAASLVYNIEERYRLYERSEQSVGAIGAKLQGRNLGE